MFDIGWSEFLIFAVVTLLLVGPKELPAFMRTIGKYAGMVRRQAEEFRGHFDAAMQEAELDKMQSEFESLGKGIDQSYSDAKSAVDDSAAASGGDKPLQAEAKALERESQQTQKTATTKPPQAGED